MHGGGQRQPQPGLVVRTGGSSRSIVEQLIERMLSSPHLRIEGQEAVAYQGLQP